MEGIKLSPAATHLLPHLIFPLSLIQSSSPFLTSATDRRLRIPRPPIPPMAAVSCSAATLSACAAASCSGARRKPRVRFLEGLNSFSGLKADNEVSSLGRPACAARCFAELATALRAPSKGGRSGGGALSATCDAGGEIFRIAAIVNGLVLIGVAVGFVLLRVEAWVEEQE